MFQRHRALRWLAPVGVLGVVGLAAGGMITAKPSVSDPLPGTTTAELIADMAAMSAPGFSGTVVAQMSLGLPQLPAVADERDGSSLAGLLAGSHTMRVWYGSPDHQRIALLGQTSETDVFHSGRNVWEWDSDTHVATHTLLPVHPTANHASAVRPSTAESFTPQQLATQLLAAINPSTKVTLGAKRRIADRSAYELVLTPHDATRIGSVRIAVDGTTKVPLSVQIFARGSRSPAVDVAFSDISFKTPPARFFTFAPPSGATVRTNAATSADHGAADPSTSAANPVKTFGSGWSTVTEYQATAAGVKQLSGSALSALTPVAGAWGHGRLLDAALFSALVTDDGRVFAGAVDPQALFAAASTH